MSQKLQSADRLMSNSIELESRRKELQATVESVSRKLQETKRSVKKLQSHVEGSLSTVLKGRKVNLYGDLNTM